MVMETKWTPSSPEERSYYDRLFALADVLKGGKLGGDSVVPFLAKSGLGFGVLKEVRQLRLVTSVSRCFSLFFLYDARLASCCCVRSVFVLLQQYKSRSLWKLSTGNFVWCTQVGRRGWWTAFTYKPNYAADGQYCIYIEWKFYVSISRIIHCRATSKLGTYARSKRAVTV